MSNSQTVPAQRVKHGKPVKNPFAKARAMLAEIAAASQLIGLVRANAMTSIGQYFSRGKGKGKTARSAKKPGRNRWSRGQQYPEQSTRQARPKYYTATVNGFEIMQRLDGMTQRHRLACANTTAAR